jgi:hypothetical protein
MPGVLLLVLLPPVSPPEGVPLSLSTIGGGDPVVLPAFAALLPLVVAVGVVVAGGGVVALGVIVSIALESLPVVSPPVLLTAVVLALLLLVALLPPLQPAASAAAAIRTPLSLIE